MKKIIARALQVVGLLSLLTLLLGAAGFYFAGRWLVLDEPPAKADFIVLLGGDLSRPLHGAGLYRQGCANRIIVSRPPPPSQSENLRTLGILLPRQDEQYREILQRKGVPASAIDTFGRDNLSTVQEAEAFRDYLGDRSVRLLMVTSPYHTRRVKIIFIHAAVTEGGYSGDRLTEPSAPAKTKKPSASADGFFDLFGTEERT